MSGTKLKLDFMTKEEKKRLKELLVMFNGRIVKIYDTSLNKSPNIKKS